MKIPVCYGLSKHYREGKQDLNIVQSSPNPAQGGALLQCLIY